MTEKDIQVSLSDDRLIVKGEKRREKEEEDRGYHLTERTYGEFQRSFILPDGVNSEEITAEFANGVLTLTLPKTRAAMPKKIEVKAAA